MPSTPNDPETRDKLLTPEADRPSGGRPIEGPSADPSDDPSETPLQDWIEAENSRPNLPEETADGLDDMDEEVRRQAEDLPGDTPGRL